MSQFSNQNGAALFVSLILLLVLTIVGLSAAQRSNMQEKMASNTHIQHMAFNASESALGGFIVEANTGDKTAASHILFPLRVNGSMNAECYDQTGTRVGCGGVFLDGDKAGSITAQVSARVVNPCNTVMCSGYSLGRGTTKVGCRIFEINGSGQVGNSNAQTDLWAYEVTACTN